MISHFYLQRSETRSERHFAPATNYLFEKEIPDTFYSKYKAMGIDQSNVADIESAYTSSAMMRKIIYDKKQQLRKKMEKK
jgi:hypothetical protein